MHLTRVSLRQALFVLPLLLVAGADGAAAPSGSLPSVAELDAIVAPYVADRQFSGAILIVRDREVLFDKAYGFANLESNIPNTTSTSFHIGALSAQFTCAAIGQLVAKKHLDWDNTADQFVAGAPQASIRALLDADPYTPGGRAAYRLLARIAENVTAKSFGDVVNTVVFGPLWLQGAGLDDGTVSGQRIAKGYVRADSGTFAPAPRADWTARMGEGSAYLTTRDEFAWIQKQYGDMLSCHARGWEGTDAGTTEAMCRTSSHGDGFASYVFFAPSVSHLAIVVLANVDTDAAAGMGQALAARFPLR